MIQKALTEFSIRRPKLVMTLCVIITLFFLAALPSLKTDTDPVHMLPADNPVVTLYTHIKKEFKLNDFIGIGIKSKDGSSLFTVDGLTKIHTITKEILEVKDVPPSDTAFSRFFKKLQFLRKSSPQNEGAGSLDILVKEDVVSISTVDDIVKNEAGELLVTPLMESPPQTETDAHRILEKLNSNPMLAGKMISRDGSLVGIFLPLVKGKKDRSFYLGGKIKEICEKYLGENEEYHFAGLPIAEATFGSEMFIQMGVYAPMAGLVIFLLMLFFFRSRKMVAAPMILGMTAVSWSMGALVYSGNMVHIMSSMIPIFLLPIAVLDSIHILSRLSDIIGDYDDKADAIRQVMKELFNPMFYTSITTMVGFASLSTTGIPPVVVFGVTVAFGVFISWLLSMVFIPAYTMLSSKKTLAGFALKRGKSRVMDVVHSFKAVAWKIPKTIILISVIALIISYIGVSKIVINDNPVRWFKADHPIRVANDVMNEKLAGTYLSTLYFSFPAPADSGETEEDEFAEEDSLNPVTIKDPRVIRYMAKVLDFVSTVKTKDGRQVVGDVTSFLDILKKVGEVALNDNRLPDSREKVSQYMFLFESGDQKRGKDMWKVISPGDSLTSQAWVHFNSGDNQDMQTVMNALEDFMEKNPAPVIEDGKGGKIPLEINWSGLVYINNAWQAEMVKGMSMGLLGSFVIVFFMMFFLFRSIKWAAIAMLPLTLTIMMIYGFIGLTGRFYDMPIAVLSSLTLGLSIDFAIHFIEHARMFNKELKQTRKTFDELFNGTAQAIWRNVLVISVGFSPLFFAGLVPYKTVGAFFFAIMLVSGIATLILLPAVLRLFSRYLPGFKEYEK
jgi:predicted RND superfamily exporter protein